jgi:hypothetical protein
LNRTSGSGPRANENCSGSYPRSIRFANKVLARGAALLIMVVALRGLSTNVDWLLPFFVLLLAWGAFVRFDRRVYLVITAEGIWCRTWGKERHSFSEFKAVYPRQNRLQTGVAFVPWSPAEFRRGLSWRARYSMRTGDGIPAHVGTLTLWATPFGLNRDRLLVALQAEILKAQENSPGTAAASAEPTARRPASPTAT